MQPGLQQRLERLRKYRSGAERRRHVKAGDETLTIVQRSERVHTPLKANVQMQIGGLGNVALQQRKGHVMACANDEELVALIAGIREHACEIGAQSFDVRLHARSNATFRPQQSFGQLRRARSLALRPENERLAECLFPLSQRSPKGPIRTPRSLRRKTK